MNDRELESSKGMRNQKKKSRWEWGIQKVEGKATEREGRMKHRMGWRVNGHMYE